MEEIDKSNPELKALQQEYQAALEKAPQVRQLPEPTVGVGAFLLPVETRLGAQRARFSASQMFPWFGTPGAREEVALANARALSRQMATAELELVYRVKAAYFQLYENRKSREIIRENIRILESLLQLALSKVESGQGNAADVLQTELKVRELEQELLILDKEAEKPRADLNQLLNRPLARPIEITDSLAFALLPFDKDTLLAHIRDHHPMLSMYAWQQEASRKSIELSALEGSPTFGIGMDYILVTSRSDADPLNNGRDIVQLSASVTIPLFRDKYKAREREEKLRIQALENRITNAENQFLASVEKAFSDHEIARLRQQLYTRQTATLQSAIRMLQAEYSSTGSRFDELLQLERELLAYDLQLLQALVQSQKARAEIERYITF